MLTESRPQFRFPDYRDWRARRSGAEPWFWPLEERDTGGGRYSVREIGLASVERTTPPSRKGSKSTTPAPQSRMGC